MGVVVYVHGLTIFLLVLLFCKKKTTNKHRALEAELLSNCCFFVKKSTTHVLTMLRFQKINKSSVHFFSTFFFWYSITNFGLFGAPGATAGGLIRGSGARGPSWGPFQKKKTSVHFFF